MAQRATKENYSNVPTTYVTSPVQVYPTVFLPTQVIKTYSTPSTSYTYNSKGQYYQTQPVQTKTTTTKTTTTTTVTNTNANYNPHSIYYSNGQYQQALNPNNIKYATKTYNQEQIIQNNQPRKTVPVQQYQQIIETKPQIQTHPSGEANKNVNNIVYTERKTNYPKSNVLNLNNIYNMNNTTVSNANKVNNVNNRNTNNIKYDYTYYNNNMYMVESGNIGNQKQNTQKVVQNNVVPSNYYYNNSNSQHNPLKTNQNILAQNTNVNNPNININYNNNANINLNKNINNQAKINSNNQNNIYLNNKIIINNKKTTNNKNINYSGYQNQQNIINNNNKTMNYTNYEVLLEEPPDNPRKKARNNVDNFNNTMPNLKPKNDIAPRVGVNTNIVNTTERKSFPIQAISNFEISFNNTPQIENKIEINQKQNNIPVTSNNINISNNINKQNIQSNKTNNINNQQYVEYKDIYGNVYVLINGKYVDKRTLTQLTANANQNKIISNQPQKVKTNINNQQNDINYQNKDNVYFEDNTQAQISSNPVTFYDSYNGQIINNQNQQIKIKETNYNNVNLNQIQQEFNSQNNTQYNNYFNNTYPLKGQKVYKNEYIIDNNIPTNQNINIDQRNNRFIQDQNYINLNTNNINYNINYTQQPQQQQINYNSLYKKTNAGAIGQNDILTVEPQKVQKKRPVYKIPPSKKRAVSQGRSLAFIHKYYDENFILEEDNEDNASDSENKKKQTNKLKNIFREVTNIKRLIPKPNEMNENKNQSENENENNEEKNNLEDFINNNNDNSQNVNIEQNLQNMRLSHIRFSLERSIKPDENNKDNNEEEKKIDTNNNEREIEGGKKNIDSENNQHNIELNSEAKTTSGTISQSQLDISEKLSKENLSNNNIRGSKKSDSLNNSKNSLDNININSEIKNSQEYKRNLKNIDINNDSEDNIRESNLSINPNFMEQRDIRDSNMSSITPNFMDPRDIHFKDSLLNSNINVEGNQNINIEKDNIEDKEDNRISLNIDEHDLDKYFKKEGINQRDPKQKEISYSLKTINLEDENRNSQIIIDNIDGEDQKSKLGNSYMSNNISRGNSKEGNQLLTLDDALKGSVNLSQKMQNFVSNNNKLYKDNKNSS